jgi:hypothetical protein
MGLKGNRSRAHGSDPAGEEPEPDAQAPSTDDEPGGSGTVGEDIEVEVLDEETTDHGATDEA